MHRQMLKFYNLLEACVPWLGIPCNKGPQLTKIGETLIRLFLKDKPRRELTLLSKHI